MNNIPTTQVAHHGKFTIWDDVLDERYKQVGAMNIWIYIKKS